METVAEKIARARRMAKAALFEQIMCLRQAHITLRVYAETSAPKMKVHEKDVEQCDCEVALVCKIASQNLYIMRLQDE